MYVRTNLPAVRLWKKLPCIQIMIQSVKQPGISSGSPGYHQTVTSCFLKHPFSILRCKNITVSNNWNPHSLLHLTDNLPVRLSRIELFSCSSVDCREIGGMIYRHAQMQTERKGENLGMKEMRKHIAWYTAGLRHSAGIRRQCNTLETLEELRNMLEEHGMLPEEF